MAGFLYYFGDMVNAPTEKLLKEMKLDHLAGVNFSQVGYPGSGQMAVAGVICAAAQSSLCPGGTEPKVGYYPENQIWEKASERWWIGWEKENPPGPADLAKIERRWGHEVKMGDGGVWAVPPERYLPDQLVLNDNDEVDRVPMAQFDGVKKLTMKLRSDFCGQIKAQAQGEEWPPPEMTEAEQLRAGNFFLGLNYRVGRVEANVLKLWNDQSLRKALEAILDWPGIVAMIKEKNDQKKK